MTSLKSTKTFILVCIFIFSHFPSVNSSSWASIVKKITIDSVPQGASVFLKRSRREVLIGKTPLDYSAKFHSKKTLIRLLVKKQGYENFQTMIRADQNKVIAELTRLRTEMSLKNLGLSPSAYPDVKLQHAQTKLNSWLNKILPTLYLKDGMFGYDFSKPISVKFVESDVYVVFPVLVTKFKHTFRGSNKEKERQILNALWLQFGETIILPLLETLEEEGLFEGIVLDVSLSVPDYQFGVKAGYRNKLVPHCVPGYVPGMVLDSCASRNYKGGYCVSGYRQGMVYSPCAQMTTIDIKKLQVDPNAETRNRTVHAKFIVPRNFVEKEMALDRLYEQIGVLLENERGEQLVAHGYLPASILKSSGFKFEKEDVQSQPMILLKQKNWRDALKFLRQAIEGPAIQEKEYLGNLRYQGILILSEFAHHYGGSPKLDKEAIRYFEEALTLNSHEETFKAQVNDAMGRYFQRTHRNGEALPYYKKAMISYQKLERDLELMVTSKKVAEIYRDRGEKILEKHYIDSTRNLLFQYLSQGPDSKSSEQEGILNQMIRKLIQEASNTQDIQNLWDKSKDRARKDKINSMVFCFSVAENFARVGALRKATDLYNECNGFLEQMEERKENQLVIKNYQTCALATIRFLEGTYAEANKQLQLCLEGWSGSGEIAPNSTLLLAGRIYVALGKLEEAIQIYESLILRFEKNRGSFKVSKRRQFFSGPAKIPYWGLISTLANRAEQTNKIEDVIDLLQAMEKVRARQLGDKIDPFGEDILTPQSLLKMQEGLPSKTIFLSFIITDRSIITVAIEKNLMKSSSIPIDRKSFEGQIHSLAKLLGNGFSHIEDISKLYRSISSLILGPISHLLVNKNHIFVVPDGILNLIPFDLMRPQEGVDRPLILDKVVQIVPSLRLFQHLASQEKAAQVGLMALGDPVYPRSPVVAGLSAEQLRTVARGNQYLSYFTRLPETRTEVQAIAKMIPPTEPLRILLGPSATESALKATNFKNFRYIHLATHGIVGGEVPGIGEPALVLGEEPQEDGFFRASEAQALDLQAELTVLSACKTGTGELVTGEGVLGMSRAFLVAGSRGVVVSLWNVASRETETFMVTFYQYLQEGLKAAKALRQAKLDMVGVDYWDKAGAKRGIDIMPEGKEKEGRVGSLKVHPYFWAPFIFVGV